MNFEIKEIIYMPTLRCNLTCKHCTVKHFYTEKEEMSCLEVLEKIKASKLLAEHCHVSICGGEVFLKRDLEDLILGLINDNEREYYVDLTTNGYYVERIESLIQKVEHPQRLRFSVSIDGIEEIHNKIRGNDKAYDNVMTSLKLIAERGISVEVNTVMQPDNFFELAEMKEKFNTMHDNISFTPIPMMKFSNTEDTFAFKDSEINEIYPYIRNNIDMKGIISQGKFRLENCHGSIANIVIDPIGKVFPCAFRGQLMSNDENRDEAQIGNLKEQSIDEIFTGEQKKNVYENIVKKCGGCNHNCDMYRERELFGLKYSVSLEEAKYVLKNVPTLTCFYDFNWEPIEYDNGIAFRWMNDLKANIFVRHTGDLISLKFKSMYENLTVSVSVEEKVITVIASKGMNEIEIPVEKSAEGILVCEISVEKVWIPSEHTGGNDSRTLGIALYQLEVREKNIESSIDVAKIMAEITIEAEKRYSEVALEKKKRKQYESFIGDDFELAMEITNGNAQINGQLCHLIKANNHVLAEKMAEILTYGDIPWKIPDFGWKKQPLRCVFKSISKVVLKLTRFITTRQKELNDTMKSSLELLQASTLSTADWSLDVEKRLQDLTITVKDMLACIESQRYMLTQLYQSINVNISDDMYQAFEEKYRGSKTDIENKQRYYIDNFIKGRINPEAVGLIVDLGCGRGEWLTLLIENGYRGIGVDRNDTFLQCCDAKDIATVKMDVVDYLKTLPCESVKLLTSFQLVEHISTNQLIELLSEIGRVMRPDGMIIIETPNPENVSVGASAFYLDPTHKRQVHPELLRFLAEENGFSDAEIVYWQQEEIEQWWDSVWMKDSTNIADSNINRAIETTLKQSLWSPSDYALVARK